MTRWIESQIETRAKLDSEMTERAYAELAASVSNPQNAPHFSVNDVEQVDGASRACLRFLGIHAGHVPDDITDVEERLDWLCRPTGTMRRRVQLTDGWQDEAFGAMLGRLDTGEAVALLPRGVHGYCYLEPGTGIKRKITAKNAKHFETDAILFYKGLPNRPLAVRDLMMFIIGAFRFNDYMLVCVAALAVALMGFLPAWANKVAFGVVAPSGQSELILPIAAFLLGMTISTVLITACRNLIMQRISLKLDMLAESAAFARVLSLPNAFFRKYSSGDLASRVANVTLFTQHFTSVMLGSALTTLISLVYVLQIGAFAPALTFPALITMALQVLAVVFITSLTARFEVATVEASAHLSGEVTALLNGVRKIKLAGAEDRAFSKWAHSYSEYARSAYNRPAVTRAVVPIVTFIGLLGLIAMYYLAGASGVTVDNYMAFNAAYGQMSAAVLMLAQISDEMARIKPMLNSISPILDAQPEISEGKPSVESITGSVEVADVSFRYGDTQPYVLKNLSFSVKPGEYVALVGASGCGKSTVMRLLLGFEMPERGRISYGPYDVRRVDLKSLRRHIGAVMQDGSLFMGDIASNISISTPSATLDDVWNAAEIAGIAEDIRKMPMGMQTLVSEGAGGVSGGQRQRIMIARAVCGGHRILLFDEATSALDNVTQRHVVDSLAALKCTRIVIAHRLSTVRYCDRIIVLNEGRVAEEGTYEELIQKHGLFAGLVERQRLDT